MEFEAEGILHSTGIFGILIARTRPIRWDFVGHSFARLNHDTRFECNRRPDTAVTVPSEVTPRNRSVDVVKNSGSALSWARYSSDCRRYRQTLFSRTTIGLGRLSRTIGQCPHVIKYPDTRMEPDRQWRPNTTIMTKSTHSICRVRTIADFYTRSQSD